MSMSCGWECVVCLGCSHWAWKHLTYIGNYDSDFWPPDDFTPVPRIYRAILVVYEDDLSRLRRQARRLRPDLRPHPSLPHLHRPRPRIDYAQTSIRGLNLVRNNDYKVLLDNRLGMQMFDGGFIYHGLLKASTWVLNRETDTLRVAGTITGPNLTLNYNDRN